MTCGCKNNKCNAYCGDAQGNDCQNDADCHGDKNNFTIKEFNNIIYQKKYLITYLDEDNYNMQNGGGAKTSLDVSNWSDPVLENNHPNAKKVYADIVNEFGNPDILVNQKGGIAIWNNLKDGIHHEIILRDEAVKHCVPANHYDFLTSYVKVFIPPEKFLEIMSVSGSVSYDGLKNLLSARCGSIDANLATLKTCLSILNNEKQDYKKNIMQKGKEMNNNSEIIKKILKENNKLYSKQMKDPFYELAFPDGCSK